jgi:hypothetical protein
MRATAAKSLAVLPLVNKVQIEHVVLPRDAISVSYFLHSKCGQCDRSMYSLSIFDRDLFKPWLYLRLRFDLIA